MYKGVISVKVIDDYKLLLCFDNGEEKIFDAMPILSYGRFNELNNLNLFRKVRVSFDTVEWENGLDLDPEYLYANSKAI